MYNLDRKRHWENIYQKKDLTNSMEKRRVEKKGESLIVETKLQTKTIKNRVGVWCFELTSISFTNFTPQY